MNKYQSIISAVISAACIFLVPYLNRKGIIVDESTMTTVIAGLIATGAFIWTAWKNHNLTDAAYEAQLIMKELKECEAESESEFDNDENEIGEEGEE
ncbi:MAG: hypothetical protein Q4C80_04225 [Bacillota bacterium]|nr:hypothetical protein [Bacillota bacterium]